MKAVVDHIERARSVAGRFGDFETGMGEGMGLAVCFCRTQSSEWKGEGEVACWRVALARALQKFQPGAGAGGAQRRVGAAAEFSCAAAYLRDRGVDRRHGYPHLAGTTGARGCEHDDDLHPCDESTGGIGTQPAGSDVGSGVGRLPGTSRQAREGFRCSRFES